MLCGSIVIASQHIHVGPDTLPHKVVPRLLTHVLCHSAVERDRKERETKWLTCNLFLHSTMVPLQVVSHAAGSKEGEKGVSGCRKVDLYV